MTHDTYTNIGWGGGELKQYYSHVVFGTFIISDGTKLWHCLSLDAENS